MSQTADHLAGINQPSLLVFAANDPFSGADVGDRVASALPNAQLHIVDGGHAPWLHHADQVASLITGFLATWSSEERRSAESAPGPGT